MTEQLPIGVSIIARNEAHTLSRCLASVAGWVGEVVVVVNDCIDDTENVARRFGSRVITHPWRGYRDQKQFALSQISQPWVLSIDADEEVSEELRNDIHAFFQGNHTRFAGAMFPRKVWFLGRWITHGDWYPDWSLRLFRKELGRWGGSSVHEKLELDGKACRLPGDLLHYSNPTLSSYNAKISHFSDLFLQQQLEKGKKWSLADCLLRPLWRFLRAYIFRLGFLDGYAGYYIAMATAFSTLVRYSRLYEHERGGQQSR
jgi:glycosyltransferase involved in cell wall biosynthesis